MTRGAVRDRAWRRKLIVTFGIALTVLALDQLTKWLIERRFLLGEGLWLIDEVLMLSHVRNPGVAFGLLSDLAQGWRLPFFLATSAVAAWLLVTIYGSAGHLPLGRVAVGLIAGGAVGNLTDRVRYGEVVDFIDVWIGPYHWPTFNVADSAITVGTGILLFALWRAKAL